MIDKVLEERGSRYGAFKDHAYISQKLQTVLWDTPNWDDMPLDSRQSLVVICDKIARMLNGDPNYDDNWIDIIGYAQLVLNRIKADARDKEVKIDSGISTTVDKPQLWNPLSLNEVVGINKSTTPSYGTDDTTE